MDESELTITVSETRLAFGSRRIGSFQLHKFQEEAVSLLGQNSSNSLLQIIAGTGLGKTAIPVCYSILPNKKQCFLVYPTNELIVNQRKSIFEILSKITQENYTLHTIFSSKIVKLAEEAGFLTKAPALGTMLESDWTGEKKFILSNPDTLHLILWLKYGTYRDAKQLLPPLVNYETLVIDEFHNYTFRELNNILFDIGFSSLLGMFPKVILMTATPHPFMDEYLRRLCNFIEKTKFPRKFKKTVKAEALPITSQEGRLALGSVQLKFIPLDEHKIGRLEAIIALVKRLYTKIENTRRKNASDDEFVPLIIIVDSVMQARAISEELKKMDIKIRECHGLVPKSLRGYDEETEILVGTSSIELGIDFKTDMLIFEAKNASSFLQRFGRVGRGRKGEGFAFIPDFIFKYLKHKITANDQLDRKKFNSIIKEAYIEKDLGNWYIQSPYGALEQYIYVQKLISIIKGSEVSSSVISDEELKTLNRLALLQANLKENEISQLLENQPVLKILKKRMGVFRETTPQIAVDDQSAANNRFFPFYLISIQRLVRNIGRFKIIPYKDYLFSLTTHLQKSDLVDSGVDTEILDTLRMMLRYKRKVITIKVFNYAIRPRTISMKVYEDVDEMPFLSQNTKDKLSESNMISFRDNELKRFDSVFEDEIFCIVRPKTSNRIPWTIPRYPVYDSRESFKGYIFWGLNSLIALSAEQYKD